MILLTFFDFSIYIEDLVVQIDRLDSRINCLKLAVTTRVLTEQEVGTFHQMIIDRTEKNQELVRLRNGSV